MSERPDLRRWAAVLTGVTGPEERYPTTGLLGSPGPPHVGRARTRWAQPDGAEILDVVNARTFDMTCAAAGRLLVELQARAVTIGEHLSTIDGMPPNVLQAWQDLDAIVALTHAQLHGKLAAAVRWLDQVAEQEGREPECRPG